ncbi:glycosyltransferase [Deinococcus humi]|uniref:Glycosyltransferase involved in cell wall biosynthesis n=1 Tax=Deinococcus humi TaxID=662880 RepID=A0A7W8JRQ3_9DEIO|nr:glycosyltransferase [Deinococcus humi]MBB5361628.1 glycosyltransferase involved in cell wall biosynthesis [Deinococcus humi]
MKNALSHDIAPHEETAPLISVVIPTYRRPELLLRRGLRSALAQRYPNLEVLVVMDGPDVETSAALAAIDDPRLRPLTLPRNQGPSAARNYGVQHARGEWIAFLDDDDVWRPDKLTRQMQVAQRSVHPLPVVLSGYIERTPYGDQLYPTRPKAADESLGDYMFVRRSARPPGSAVFGILVLAPRALALRVPWPTHLRNNEDWDWLLRVEETPGVGFEQLPPEDASTLAIYYRDEDRSTGSGVSSWRPMLEWAQGHRRAGRLSDRAYAGFLLAQVVPRAVRAGDPTGLPVLGLALLATRPGPSELASFLKHWAVPAPLRRRLRRWLNTRRAPVRLGNVIEDGGTAPDSRAGPPPDGGRRSAVKVTFLIESMRARAGMERVTATVAGGLAALGLDVQIVALRGETSAFELPEAVILTSLGLPEGTLRMRAQTVPLVRAVRKELQRRRPDVLITVDTFLAGFVFPALLDLPMLRVAWEHFNFRTDLNMRSRRLARVIAAHLGHRVVTLTRQDRDWWRAAFPQALASITAIPNPLTVDRPAVNPHSPQSRVVLGVGRLDPQKGFDLLLRAWAEIEADCPEWRLQIYGQGPEEQALRDLAEELGLRRWELFAPTSDVAAVYRTAGIYALSSRHEGLPLVLMETQAHGVPAVAFDCLTGPAELLAAGGGALMPAQDVSAFASALQSLMSQPELRQEWSERAYAGAERYRLEPILGQWLRLLAAGHSGRPEAEDQGR